MRCLSILYMEWLSGPIERRPNRPSLFNSVDSTANRQAACEARSPGLAIEPPARPRLHANSTHPAEQEWNHQHQSARAAIRTVPVC